MDISVTQDGPVAVITWNEGENRINVDSLGRLNEILDELDSIEGPLAIVLTGKGKFFCNGLDLERFGTDAEQYRVTIEQLNRFIGRLLVYPAYTVAALNGHTFAGGNVRRQRPCGRGAQRGNRIGVGGRPHGSPHRHRRAPTAVQPAGISLYLP